jgi:DNA-binding HxlR family transcriptional regulator
LGPSIGSTRIFISLMSKGEWNCTKQAMNYHDFETCGLKRVLDMLSGKWKPLIMLNLFQNDQIRFIELWRNMPRVSKKVLLEQLRQMEVNGLIERLEINGFPPEVYYRLSERGRALGPNLQSLDEWGRLHAT